MKKIENDIYLVRVEKVMLDRELASLYDVSTAPLNQVVTLSLEMEIVESRIY
jgi:hypothetical protein